MHKLSKAEITAQIAALEAELTESDGGVYEDPKTGRWFIVLRPPGRAKTTTRRRAPDGSRLTGNLQRPIIIGHGTHDPIVSPGETAVYKRLVEQRFGVAGARERLAVYYIPGMGHGGAQFDAMIGPALDALDAWVDYRQSAGTTGSPPPDPIVTAIGSYPRD